MLPLLMTLIPMSLFIGLSASAIGYTAWSLLIPILFIIFGFDLYVTLFISLLTDSANAILMTALAARHDQIDFWQGIRFLLFACIWVILGVYLGTTFIPNHENWFKESAGYFNLIFALIFFHRGLKIKKKMSHAHGAPPVPAASPSPTRAGSILIYGGIAIMAFQTGIFGIGGGMGYSVFLILLLRYPTLKATGTAMFITSLTALVAASGIFLQVPPAPSMIP